MKVAHVTMFFCPPRGGQEAYIQNLLTITAARGVESVVVQPPTGCTRPDVIFTPALPQQILRRFGEGTAWFAFNIGLRFRKTFLHKQDILLCHYPFHYPSLRWHKKVVIISHGVLWHLPPRTMFDRYHRFVARHLPADVTIVANDTHFLRELGHVIAPKTGYFEEVAKHIWFIPNCVDTTLYTRDPAIASEKTLLVPRNIRRDRGVHLAIEAFNLLKERYPDYTLTVVGKSNAGPYFSYCQELVRRYGLEQRIIFTGHKDAAQMRTYYNRAALTIIPSTEKEGTSLSALESMACGTPAVITNVGGLPDLPGVLAEPDAKDLAQKIAYILEHREEIAAQQQQHVRSTFTLQHWADAWMRVLTSVNNRTV